ncbi:Pollen-specific protein-like At4g18596 [Linum perenne]
MNPIILVLFLSFLFIKSLSIKVEPAARNAHFRVMGFVYCDICSNNSFTKHSYFMPGAEVRIECKFKASAPKTREQIAFSVNRTTNRNGMYKLEIPAVDGIECAESAIASSCEASLMWTPSKSCNVPGYRSTSDEIEIKSRKPNLCVYSLNALNFRPSKRNASMCGH